MSTFDKVEKVRQHLSDIARQYWMHNNLFTWQWWLLIGLTIIPWWIWWRFVDKKRILEISLYGACISLLAIVLDVSGSNFLLWGYPQHLLWFLLPLFVPADLSTLPVEHMLIYQYFRSWKSFIWALIIVAIICAFVVEPLFVSGDIYKPYSWRYVYSVPLYVLKAIVARMVIQKLLQYQKRSSP